MNRYFIGTVLVGGLALLMFAQVPTGPRFSPNSPQVTSQSATLTAQSIIAALGYIPASGGSGGDAALKAGNNAFTGSNYFAKAITVSTNQNQITPDFSLPEQLISTNAAFTFLAPVGVDSTKTTAQWHVCNVTNTTAVAVAMTSPANCHTIGTAFVTNWTAVWFQCYASKITNAYYTPGF